MSDEIDVEGISKAIVGADERERRYRRTMKFAVSALFGLLFVVIGLLLYDNQAWRDEVGAVRRRLNESQTILADVARYDACRAGIVDAQANAQADYLDAFGQLIESLAANPPSPDVTAEALAVAAERRQVLHEASAARAEIEQRCPVTDG